MSNTIPDGPTDPRLSSLPESTTVVSGPPGFGPPPGSPAAAPPPPPTTIVSPQEAGGRVYSTGEGRSGGGAPSPGPGADRGKTTIADEVVERVIDKIVTLTVAEVAGVHGLHAVEGQPVSVQLDGDRAEISISIQVEFGHAVHAVVEQVRSSVIGQAEKLLGLTITEVNVLVADVTFDSAD